MATITWFGVRHHSVTAALLLRELIAVERFDAVLVEGPSDYNPQVAELGLDHAPPISIYSWTTVQGRPYGAYYPLCEYSPEWQAVRCGLAAGAEVAFIDLPWAELIGFAGEHQQNRFADEGATARFARELCARLGVETFSDAWDELIEIPRVDLATYLERVEVLGRALHGDVADDETAAREEFMAAQVADAVSRHRGGRLLVVTGAAHTAAVRELVEARTPGAGAESEADACGTGEPARARAAEAAGAEAAGAGGPGGCADRAGGAGAGGAAGATAGQGATTGTLSGGAGEGASADGSALRGGVPGDGGVDGGDDAAGATGSGVSLTPTSYAFLDALTGYEAGQPNPGFYHEVWRQRSAAGEGRSVALAMLGTVTRSLRQARQLVSPADLIAVNVTARGLAALRGHREVWRTDLVDGLTASLVKDEVAVGGGQRLHPLVERFHLALRGHDVGRVDPRSSRPPLVVETLAELHAEGLYPPPEGATVRLDLGTEAGLRRSRLLHRLRVLDVPAGTLDAAADLGLGAGSVTGPAGQPGSLVERWTQRWTPQLESTLVVASAYGASLERAVSNRILDDAADVTTDAAAATGLLLRAALAGVDVVGELQHKVVDVIESCADLVQVGTCLRLLMRLFRYDPVLRTTGRADLGQLVDVAFDRLVRLLERLAPVPSGQAADDVVAQVAVAVDVAERLVTRSLPVSALDQALATIHHDQAQEPSVRGGALAGLWLLHPVLARTTASEGGEVDLAQAMSLVTDPASLGDYVAGMIAVSRDVVTRRSEVLASLDADLTGWDEATFLAAVPGLRRAFAALTPREKARVSAGLGTGEGVLRSAVGAAEAHAGAELDALVHAEVVRLGLLAGEVDAAGPAGAGPAGAAPAGSGSSAGGSAGAGLGAAGSEGAVTEVRR